MKFVIALLIIPVFILEILFTVCTIGIYIFCVEEDLLTKKLIDKL